MTSFTKCITSSLGVAFLLLASFLPRHLQAAPPPTSVTIQEESGVYTLTNSYVQATISKVSGRLLSLKYHGIETMGYVSGTHAGYWEQSIAGAPRLEAKITIDPKSNNGERAEVSIKGWADGSSLTGHMRPDPGAAAYERPETQLNGRKPGPPADSQRKPNAGTFVGRSFGGGFRAPKLIVDLEIRYTLGKTDEGLYTYAIFSHPSNYGATELGESRFGVKLNQKVFDWLSIDEQRNALMPTGRDWDEGIELNMKEARRLTTGIYKGRVEHKYDYSARQFETPTYGWASSKQHIGLYFINPSTEYLSAGPYHFELTGHLDDGDGGDPTLLDYWRGTHYGGSQLPIKAGEDWNKVIGPIFIYLTSGETPESMFAKAKLQAEKEKSQWPYSWVKDADYPNEKERGTVRGQLTLKDPPDSETHFHNLLVGLTHADEEIPSSEENSKWNIGPGKLTWQSDAKYYQFWVHGTDSGEFNIPNVRPGTYVLHAVSDGVLGEYQKAQIKVEKGRAIELGNLVWTPVRYGKQLWQIGEPNRSASEFLRGNDHWHWGLYCEYSKLFPHDVDYTVGRSDYRKDWFIYQVPHIMEDDGTGRAKGRATTWTIRFQVSSAEKLSGKAILRVAFSAVSTRSLSIGVNGKQAGEIGNLGYNATINRDGIQGSWEERDLSFPAELLHPGENLLTLTTPEGSVTSGVAYDVLRLELAQ